MSAKIAHERNALGRRTDTSLSESLSNKVPGNGVRLYSGGMSELFHDDVVGLPELVACVCVVGGLCGCSDNPSALELSSVVGPLPVPDADSVDGDVGCVCVGVDAGMCPPWLSENVCFVVGVGAELTVVGENGLAWVSDANAARWRRRRRMKQKRRKAMKATPATAPMAMPAIAPGDIPPPPLLLNPPEELWESSSSSPEDASPSSYLMQIHRSVSAVPGRSARERTCR